MGVIDNYQPAKTLVKSVQLRQIMCPINLP